MMRIPVFVPLVDKDGHDGELVVRLKQYLLNGQKPRRTLQKWSGIVDGCTEVAGCSGSILDGKRVITTVPFQSLMAEPERVSIRCRNYCSRWCCATFRRGIVEPHTAQTQGSLQVIETHIDVAFGEVSVRGDNIGPRTGQERNGHLADTKIDILDTATVAAHVERVEVSNLNVLAAVVS